MRLSNPLRLFLLLGLLWQTVLPQNNCVNYNKQQLFLSGSNLAWMSFANDIGPGARDYTSFGDILVRMHTHGGNALRWWLHTNGVVTPAFNDTGLVVGPGTGTIESLRRALDIAWQREIGVKLCLWSFDMLRATNGGTVVARNLKLLTDSASTMAYINNCLIPMVDSLKGHPAIIAWEIFNEPEGMTNEFYFYRVDPHVPMSAIQKFVNLCAGAIHRRDSSALVTNGAWSFKALTDVSMGTLAKGDAFVPSDKQQMLKSFNKKYGYTLSTEEFDAYLQRISVLDNYNYYSDSRLIALGGDPKGTLDFYCVHYYDWGGTQISPLHHPSNTWQLNKPIVVAEFALKDTYGVLKEEIYKTLFRNGYAGALAWSWTDVAFSTAEDMLAGMKSLWDNYRSAVDVQGIGADWAEVAIVNPKSDSVFAAGSPVTVEAAATLIDDGRIVLIEFFANDTLKIGERNASPYSVTWTNPPSGLYMLTAAATGNLGHRSSSSKVRIQVGTPSTVRLEAETASLQGSGMTVRTDNTASGGRYLDIATNDSTVKITWQLRSVPAAGTYQVAFGYKLFYASPKSQFIIVNGVRVSTLEFTAASTSTWYEKTLSVNLLPGDNTIQMQMSWGWMYLDYLAVPRSLVTSVEDLAASVPLRFSLEQNYPNPFNPTTAVSFQLSAISFVTLKVHDVLGREVATLLNEMRPAGSFTIQWDGSSSPTGVYFYTLQARPVDGGQAGDASTGSARGFVETKKMILLK